MAEWSKEVGQAAGFAITGALIGIGQLLGGGGKLTKRIVIGRALSSGGLAMVAGVVYIWLPHLSFVTMLGVAAALASLGTSALEQVFQKYIGGPSK